MAGKRHRRADVERVADADVAADDHAHDVARERLVEHRALLAEDLVREVQRQRAPGAGVVDPHPALEASRADPDERHAVAVARVHVGLDLEHERGEVLVDGTQGAVVDRPRQRRGRELAQRVQQQPDAEVPRRRAEQQRDQLAAQERLGVELAADLVDELELLLGDRPRLVVVRVGLAARGDDVLQRPRAAAGHARELVEGLVAPVDHAAELARDADRPRQRRQRQAERLGQVVDHPERLHAGPVVLVHERDQRDAARAGDLEELLGLGLDAAGGVDQDHGGVDRGQHPQRVLGEVLVARGVEQVEDDALVLEAQHGGGDRDAAAALEVHPVRRRRLLPAARGDRARLADRARVQEQLLGEGGLARVRVRDDGEGAPARRLLHHESVIHEDSGYERYVRAAA